MNTCIEESLDLTKLSQLREFSNLGDFAKSPMIFGVCEQDTDKLLYLDGDFEGVTGYKKCEFINKTYHSLVHPEDKPEGVIAENTWEPGIMYKYRWIHKDGHTLDMYWFIIQDQIDRNYSYFIGILMNTVKNPIRTTVPQTANK